MFKRGFLLICFLATPAWAVTPVIVVHPLPAQSDVKKTPGNASFTDIKQMPDRRAVTIKDLTDYVPSVYAQPRNGAESSRLAIRGAGLANTFQGRGLLVMEDGVPINMADGEFEYPVINPWRTSYVRVMPGANALAEGSSTLGGAIDFMTPENIEGGTIRAEGGSFGTMHGLAGYGKTVGNINLSASADDFHQDGFRDNNNQDIGHINAQGTWRMTPELTQRLMLSHTVSNAQIPGAISWRELQNDPTTANPANVAGQYERNLEVTRLADKIAWQDGDNKVETTLYYAFRTLDNPVTTYIKEINNDTGLRVKYSRGYWTSGVNFAYGTQDETRYTNVFGHEGAHILDRNLYATNSEMFTQIDHPLIGKLSGIASVQGAFDTRDIRQSYPSSNKETKTYLGFNPRVGLRYDMDSQHQIFANVSRSFEPPTWAELSGGNTPGFKSLNSQTATTMEIGTRGARWSAALFRSYLHNEFVNYEFADGSSDTINAGKSVHDGLELGWNGDIARDTEFHGAYTLSRFRLSDDPLYGSNQLPGMPEHYARAEVLRRVDAFSFGPNIEYASGYPVDLTNTVNVKSYTIFGARALWHAGNLETYVEGRNLLNKKYAATANVVPDANGADGRYYYPGEGASVYAGLRVGF